MKYGSLFSGIGGIDLGLDRAGWRCAWQVEYDQAAKNVLEKHWPDVPKYGDVRNVGIHNLQRVDLICGGFPCQDISGAGRKAGIADGKKSGLWFEFRRIIGELRPRYVIVENVAALLVRGMETVCGHLAELGYDAEWQNIPATAFGFPHRRNRIFIIAYSDSIIYRADYAAGQSRYFSGASLPVPRFDWFDYQPDLVRETNGVSGRLDRFKQLGNAVVPQIAEWIGRRIIEVDND